jgi:uncharacterized membrane protein YbhN (UPF0104 family)
MKKTLHFIISIGLTLLLVYVIYQQVPDWRRAWNTAVAGKPMFLITGIALVLLHMVLRSIRWGLLLAPTKSHVPLKTLVSLTFVKYVMNLVPPRVGEVAASVLLARKEKLFAASVLATTLLERILDLITVLALGGFYFAFMSHLHAPASQTGQQMLSTLQRYSLRISIVLLLGTVVILCLMKKRRWEGRSFESVCKFVFQFLEGFRVLRQGRMLVHVLLLSLAIWIVIALQL